MATLGSIGHLLPLWYCVMSKQLLQVQARARALAQSGTFIGWRAIAFELSFEPNYREAHDWLKEPSTHGELDDLCRRARERRRAA